MDSRWTPKILESDFRVQNSIFCGVLYTTEKLLERKYLKWARIAHLDIWNISYGQKKGWESNSQFDSRPQKVGNRPDLLVCRGHATHRWKRSRQELQLCFKPHLDLRFSRKVMGLQSRGSPNLGDFEGSLGTKSHLDVGSVDIHRVYYKGEGGGFPQVWAMVSLVCPCCPWLVLAPKVLQLCTNHLVWVLCRPIWVSEACQLFLVPSRNSSTPFYPSKCCELGSVPRLLPLRMFYTWTHICPSRSWECINFGGVEGRVGAPRWD
jgi:hypothetical protein